MIKEIRKYFRQNKTPCTTIVFLMYKWKLSYEKAAEYMVLLKKLSYKHSKNTEGDISQVFFR